MGIIRVSTLMVIRIVCPWALVWPVLVARELAQVVLRLGGAEGREDVGRVVDV